MTNNIVKQAIVAQVTAVISAKNISLVWLTDTLHKLLGIKKEQVKRTPLNRPELLKCLEYKIKSVLADLEQRATTKDIKTFIQNGGSDFLTSAIKGTPLTKNINEPTQDEVMAKVIELVGKLSVEQLWEFLDKCNKWTSKEYYNRPIPTRNSITTGYISIPQEEATLILGEYYRNLANNESVTTPVCFRGGRTSNATQHLQRLLYSYHYGTDCKQPNSITQKVFSYHLANKPNLSVDEAKNLINNFIELHPEHVIELQKLKNKSYVKSVVKKDDTPNTQNR